MYIVLIHCRNAVTGERYKRGEIIGDDAFSPDVIAEWLTSDPPVLERAPDFPDLSEEEE